MSDVVYGFSPSQMELIDHDPAEMVEVPGYGLVHRSMLPEIESWLASRTPEQRAIHDAIVAKTESLRSVETME